jgi:uncharacterized protein
MYKNFFAPVLAFALLAGGVAAPAFAQAPSAADRQQELLRIWYEIREGVAAKGDAEAMYDVALANYLARGTAEDHAKAAEWFRRAAEQGHPGAHEYLGYMYAVGAGVSKNPTKSAEHYALASQMAKSETR